jgi:hypothetical protein
VLHISQIFANFAILPKVTSKTLIITQNLLPIAKADKKAIGNSTQKRKNGVFLVKNKNLFDYTPIKIKLPRFLAINGEIFEM